MTEKGTFIYVIKILSDQKIEENSFSLIKEFMGLNLYIKILHLSKETLTSMIGLMIACESNMKENEIKVEINAFVAK